MPTTLRKHPIAEQLRFLLPGNCLREDAPPALAAAIKEARITSLPYDTLVPPQGHPGAVHLKRTTKKEKYGEVAEALPVIDASHREIRVPLP